jgi:predicted nuclease of predicted toxin-antitoxin system
MKIVIDQNISHRLILLISSYFDEVQHVKTLGWLNDSDTAIFKKAKQYPFDAILTLDEDFERILLQFGIPPKVIRLRIGNTTTAQTASILIKNIVHFS